jgi:hypothetical protein
MCSCDPEIYRFCDEYHLETGLSVVPERFLTADMLPDRYERSLQAGSVKSGIGDNHLELLFSRPSLIFLFP